MTNELIPQFGGEWTDDKLKILRLYLEFYTKVLKNQNFNLAYIDPFAGPGVWQPKNQTNPRKGSPVIAIDMPSRPFDRLVFNDVRKDYINTLKERVKSAYPHIQPEFSSEDANQFLERFCKNQDWKELRAVTFLDPFATEVKWSSLKAIAQTRAIDTLILFPISALSRMLQRLRAPDDSHRFENQLNAIFGDESWKQIYEETFKQEFADASRSEIGSQESLLPTEVATRAHHSIISYAYRKQLKTIFPKIADTPCVLKANNNTPLFEFMFVVGNPSDKAQGIAIRGAEHILRNFHNVQI